MADKKLKENQIEVGSKVYEIKPIRVLHLKNGFYSNYMTVKKMGLVKILNFSDGEQILIDLLAAIFDNEDLAKEIVGKIDVQILKIIIDKVKVMNEIEDEDPNVGTVAK